jgi:hypothetical protein
VKANKPETESPNDAGNAAAFDTGPAMSAGSVAIQAWMDMGTETLRFVWDRLQQDMKTQKAMLACTSLEEIQKVQAEFFRSAQDQYAAEARKMQEMLGKATTAGMTASIRPRRYDDVPV